MAIRAELEGNLTRDPESKFVTVDGERRQIVTLRVFSDVSRRAGDGWEQDDERSCGVDVTIWGERLGQDVLKHFRKGARVLILGQLHLNEYTDGDGAHHAGLRMAAESIGLQPYRIESLSFVPARREREADPTAA